MSKYKGKWGIVSADGSVIIPNEYDYIDCLSNPGYFKVCKGELSFEEEEEEEGCYRLVAEHGKWGVIDANNKVILPAAYDWIDEDSATSWIVYRGGKVFYNDDYQENYWMIKGARSTYITWIS